MTKPLGPGKKTKVIERSVQNNRFCFLELNKRKGQLTNPGTKLNHSDSEFQNNMRIFNQSLFFLYSYFSCLGQFLLCVKIYFLSSRVFSVGFMVEVA